MKFILFACLLAVAFAAPAPDRDARTIFEESDIRADGSYNFAFETDNGISRTQEGTVGLEGAINKSGDISFPLDDGQIMTISFVADENGYRPTISFSAGKRK